MSPRPLRFILATCLLATTALPSAAQKPQLTFEDIPWQPGPAVGNLGPESQVTVPEGCVFTGEEGTRLFMELTENTSNPGERGVLLCPGANEGDAEWFVVFTYDPSGYVKDDERGSLDGDAILKSLRQGQKAANRELASRGWATLNIEGWLTQPYYDQASNNLTWATHLTSSEGGETANHSVRLLGRGGVMHVDLVTYPAQLASVMPAFTQVVEGFSFKSGHRYAEWRAGDKVAAYGLTGLIVGGGLVAAAKSGLLAKLWKVVVAAIVAVGAAIKRIFARRPKPKPSPYPVYGALKNR
jgi:uncharacterized membrane-anchored protein